MAMSVEVAGGGVTLSELYQSSRRLLLKTRDGLERLERFEYTSSSSVLSLGAAVNDPSEKAVEDLRKDISQIQLLCSEMERLLHSIPAKSQRDLWKRKVEQVAEEVDSLKDSLDKYNLRHQRRMQEVRERTELLGRASGDSSHVLRIFDDEAQATQSARSSSRMLEETLATGTAILSKYSEQRDRLKRAQRKALDVLNTVGLSNSVDKMIVLDNRLNHQDELLVKELNFERIEEKSTQIPFRS
ncbi:hypothetical protein KY290_026663 [Solanum tuberosum]|uniref:Membrin n=1 Tax=Solanum tuberosum TaxID=4113 RepID=A0ABQ7UX33_SOLTU|nr:hypothetical protein KY284_024012 [Solanum tuberosum]KAH0756393.1 hypothetical protein KY290_026663 [Solanum tuberosum]